MGGTIAVLCSCAFPPARMYVCVCMSACRVHFLPVLGSCLACCSCVGVFTCTIEVCGATGPGAARAQAAPRVGDEPRVEEHEGQRAVAMDVA